MKLFLLFFVLSVGSDDLKKMRYDYNNMSKSEAVVEHLLETSKNSTQVSESLKTAYYAAGEMASAQFMFSPVSKINAFNSGKKKLEAAITKDPENIEIRYIRYTIQANAPGFLGYTKNVKTDREYIIKNLKGVKTSDVELFSHICAYFLTREKLTDAEKKQINA